MAIRRSRAGTRGLTLLCGLWFVGAAAAADQTAASPATPLSLPKYLFESRPLAGGRHWRLAHRIPNGPIAAIAWSPDGKSLAFAGSIDIRIADAQTFEIRRFLAGHHDVVTCLDWSPATDRLVSGSGDRTLRIWTGVDGLSPGRGTAPIVLTGHAAPVTSVAWSRDGKRLASTDQEGTLRIWEADGKLKMAIRASSAAINAVAWSSDGSRLAIGDENYQMKIWNVNGTQEHVCEGHLGPVTAVSWSPNGKWIVSGTSGYKSDTHAGYDVDVRIWKVDGSLAHQSMHDAPEYGFQCGPSGDNFATVDRGGDISIIGSDARLQVLRKARLIEKADKPVLAWRPDGKEIAVGGTGGLAVVDAADYLKQRFSRSSVIKRERNESRLIAINSRGTHAITRSTRPSFSYTYRDLVNGACYPVPVPVADFGLRDLSIAADGAEIAFIERGTHLGIWNPEKQSLRTIAESERPLRLVAWSPTGRQIACCDDRHNIRVVGDNGVQVMAWSPSQSRDSPLPQNLVIRALRWSADGKAIIAGGRSAAQVLRLDGTVVSGVEFGEAASQFWVSDDYRRYVADVGTPERPELRVWKVDHFEVKDARKFSSFPDDMTAHAVNADGSRLVVGRSNGDLEVSSVDNAALPISTAHALTPITAIAFSSDGREVASGEIDGAVKIWGAGGALKATLTGQTGTIEQINWSADGKRLTAVSNSSSIYNWSLDSGKSPTMLVPTESGPLLQIGSDGTVPDADLKIVGEEFIVVVERPDGTTEVADAAIFLKLHILLQR